ncbi:MAG: hypothetical protein JOZ24_10810 [Candidatus Eremiobacteraeota bacterium]|nr:hypothetical protein [Candidatus Eremiobacteraeota bacterium]
MIAVDPARDVAVTGVGCVTAFGYGVEAFWDGLVNGSSAVVAADEDIGAGRRRYLRALAPPEASLTERARSSGLNARLRTTLMSLLSAREAWAMAELPAGTDPARIGVMMSRTHAQQAMIGRYKLTLWEKGPSAVSGLQFVELIANSVLGRVALEFKARGPSTLIFGGTAVGLAIEALRSEDVDAVLVGAFDEASDYLRYLCAESGVVAETADARGGVGPYDRKRDGLVPGDGAAFVVLERPSFARARGKRPLAYLKGHGTVTDRVGVKTGVQRDADDLAEALRRALDDARVTSDAIAFQSGAGAGLHEFDECELAAMDTVLNNRAQVFATKGALGETWGAAGILGAIAAVLALERGVLPPTAGTHDVVAGYEARVVTGRAAPHDGAAALALNCDMLGQNQALVLAAAR